MDVTVTPLFHMYELDSALADFKSSMEKKLRQWPQDAFLNTPAHDVTETLIDKGTVECPRLRRDKAWLLEPTETTERVRDFSRVVERSVHTFTLVVPFDGEREIFFAKPANYQLSIPHVARLEQDRLHIIEAGDLTDGVRVRARFDKQLDTLDTWLAAARFEIDAHNAEVRRRVPELVARRRAELLSIRDVQAAVGFPIRKRPDAAAYSVPVKRRIVRPEAAPSTSRNTPYAPEPALADTDYEAAIQVLLNSRNALERTPSVAAGMDEETVRNMLLVFLNAIFEGNANGEVFNHTGKTDILIRERDGNVFIGECKFWDGPKSVEDALDQLLTYMAWRDTKGALLIFIRNKDVSAAIRSAVAAIEWHPNYKRRGQHDSEERVDFVIHTKGDRDREIHLALLPFAMPGDATSRFKKV